MNRAAVADAAEALTEVFDLAERFESVPLSALVESGHNARRKFDPHKLEELAASIREKGIIEPLVVRPFAMNGSAHYEIVAGARRFRASSIAGRTAVPCVIREYSDSDVLELQIVENIQREGLEPLDEAAGYAELIKSNPARYSAAFIADRIGRPEKYVWDTMRLLNLVPDAKKLLEEGRITRSHAIVLARLTAEHQKAVIDPKGGGLFTIDHAASLAFDEDPKETRKLDGLKPVSVRELEHYITEHVRFDAEHLATTDPLEFGETAKRIQEAAEKPGRGKKVIPITYAYHLHDDAKDSSERTYGVNSWKRADGQEKSKTCEHAVLGVVAAGSEEYGKVFDVCVARDKCTVHFGDVIRAKEKNAKLREKGSSGAKVADKREAAARAKQLREAEQQEREREAWRKLEPLVVADAIAQIRPLKKLTAVHAKSLARVEMYNAARFLTQALGKNWFKQPVTAWLTMLVLPRYVRSFDGYVKEIARPLKLNVKRLEAIRDKHTPSPSKEIK